MSNIVFFKLINLICTITWYCDPLPSSKLAPVICLHFISIVHYDRLQILWYDDAHVTNKYYGRMSIVIEFELRFAVKFRFKTLLNNDMVKCLRPHITAWNIEKKCCVFVSNWTSVLRLLTYQHRKNIWKRSLKVYKDIHFVRLPHNPTYINPRLKVQIVLILFKNKTWY